MEVEGGVGVGGGLLKCPLSSQIQMNNLFSIFFPQKPSSEPRRFEVGNGMGGVKGGVGAKEGGGGRVDCMIPCLSSKSSDLLTNAAARTTPSR